jgi:2-iminobutanoate/2-iminopropanoate deaminase
MRIIRWATCTGLVLVLATGCTIEDRMDRLPQAESTRRLIIQPEGVARLPVFSSAVRSGDVIYLSGALGALPGVMPPQLIEGGIEAETRQTMDNIITVLAAADATLADLIKCTVFLADIDDYAAMNSVYLEYFPSDPPARSALAGSGLALGALVEIECIAAAPEGT